MKYITWVLLAIVIIGGVILISKQHSGADTQAAAVTPLGTKTSTQTTMTKVSDDAVALDMFITQIPTITAKLQSIAKDPTSFKANLQKAQETGKFPNIGAVFGYWAISSTFTTSGGDTCGNSYVPANNQIVTEAGPGTCIIWEWTLYPWWQP